MMPYLTPYQAAQKEQRLKIAITAVALAIRDFRPGMTSDEVLELIRRVTGEDEVTTFVAAMLFKGLFSRKQEEP